jgi:hypothetical protein
LSRLQSQLHQQGVDFAIQVQVGDLRRQLGAARILHPKRQVPEAGQASPQRGHRQRHHVGLVLDGARRLDLDDGPMAAGGAGGKERQQSQAQQAAGTGPETGRALMPRALRY